MTALRSARSAWLLVGCTPLWLAKVHSAGHTFKRSRAMPRQRLLRGRFRRKRADDRLVAPLKRADRPLQLASVFGVLKDLPGPEHPLAQSQSCLAELLLGRESFGVRAAKSRFRCAQHS
jgi:hypothetical protein